jgi:hypothetical protein
MAACRLTCATGIAKACCVLGTAGAGRGRHTAASTRGAPPCDHPAGRPRPAARVCRRRAAPLCSPWARWRCRGRPGFGADQPWARWRCCRGGRPSIAGIPTDQAPIARHARTARGGRRAHRAPDGLPPPCRTTTRARPRSACASTHGSSLALMPTPGGEGSAARPGCISQRASAWRASGDPALRTPHSRTRTSPPAC